MDHIKKEIKEIEENPEDLEEWIDLIILGFDGAWRQGYSAEEIVECLEAKQSKNETREWPDWRMLTKPLNIKEKKQIKCEGCGNMINIDSNNIPINSRDQHSEWCRYVWGRRGWRQLGVYDG